MTKLHIWRMHNEFMGGPYCGKGNIYDYISAHGESAKRLKARRPVPWQDKKLSKHFSNHIEFGRRDDLRAGFNSVAAYSQWFASEELQNVCDATGFFLARYSVDEEDVMLGDKQTLFKPDNAVITAFRRCNQPGIMRSRAEINHKPIIRFLKKGDVPCEMPEL